MPSRSVHVDALIASTPGWRGATLAELRAIVHEADPDISEDAKWRRASNPLGVAVFEHAGIVCIGIVLKERVRLVLANGASLPDPKHLFNAQLAGNRTRAIDFCEGDPLRKAAVKALVRAGVKHNLARVKPTRSRSARRS